MKIQYTEGAVEDLARLPKRVAEQIIRKITRLEHGLHGDIKRLQGHDNAYRLRSGDYRILFDVEDDTAVVQRIGNRKDIYE